tara:strand:+ start:298 stop:504 length:207 start_codon:yes stop_codon:yes gene_type:complete
MKLTTKQAEKLREIAAGAEPIHECDPKLVTLRSLCRHGLLEVALNSSRTGSTYRLTEAGQTTIQGGTA